MRLAGVWLVAWCMVVSGAPHGPRERVHHTGVTVASALHHSARKRDFRTAQLPFVPPARTEWPAARAVLVVAFVATEQHAVDGDAIGHVARGPPNSRAVEPS